MKPSESSHICVEDGPRFSWVMPHHEIKVMFKKQTIYGLLFEHASWQ